MSDDIPPLMSDTPPPMTKLDWEDEEDFLDYPHSTLEMPSESSLSPESAWNPIDELPLPLDVDINKSTCLIESSFNSNSSSSTKNDQSPESSLSEPNPNLPQNDLSIWKNEQNILTSENIKKKMFTNGNVLDNKTEVSSENIVDCNNKIIDDLSETVLNNIEQHACVIEKKIITSQYLSNLEYDSGVDKHCTETSSCKNSDFKHEDVKEISSQTINEQNNLSSSDSSMNLSKVLVNDLPVNNDDNTVAENGQEDDFSGFCDFEYVESKSLNVLSPIKTFQLHNKISSELVEHCTKTGDLSLDHSAPIDEKLEKNIDSFNPVSSVIQNQHLNGDNFDHELDTEFNEFCDFHKFAANENEPTCVINDVCDIKNNTKELTDTKFKHSNFDQVKNVTTDDNSTLESDNQYNIDKDDENFCDFESGYTTFDNNGQQIPNCKQNDVILDSKSLVQHDYKKLCIDAFQEYHEFCEEVDLQNLDKELNDTQVWQNLKDIESSPALNYNWSKSEANNVFLSSLSIDSRNIFYGASLNINVPRFAANMSNSPLEPLKASINITTVTNISQSFPIDDSLQDTVPDPEFDWKTSGLINPLDCNHSSLLEIDLLPCCTNTLQPQTWKTSEVLKDEYFVKNSADICDKVFDAQLQSSDCQSTEISEHPRTTISLEAQRILDVLPEFDVLEKPYLVILENENNNLFLN